MRKTVSLALLLMIATTSMAQQMKDYFRQMPDKILPLLTTNNRLDMLDFLDSNMKAEVRNIFDGTSELTTLTDEYLFLQLTEASHVEMRLLETTEPVDSSHTIICIVNTAGVSAQESVVRFYSAQWRQ